jgi:arylformamidase
MITDWDDAYTNVTYIPDGAAYAAKWAAQAAAFRGNLPNQVKAEYDISHGSLPREQHDVFTPSGAIKGTVIFVHGGYWMRFGKSDWSHLASGCLQRGWRVVFAGYELAPSVKVSEITGSIAACVAAVMAKHEGPVRLAGHSAGGHLVSRMICADTQLEPAMLKRIQRVVSISGLHDLRPLLRTKMNETLKLTAEEAAAESPALLHPVPAVSVTCWAGADERPEFLRQNALLANIWTGLGADTDEVVVPGRHHFNVIEDLTDPESALTTWLAAI